MAYHQQFSTYTAMAAWGSSAFMAQPTIASLVVHLVILPIFLGLTVWFSHREARK